MIGKRIAKLRKFILVLIILWPGWTGWTYYNYVDAEFSGIFQWTTSMSDDVETCSLDVTSSDTVAQCSPGTNEASDWKNTDRYDHDVWKAKATTNALDIHIAVGLVSFLVSIMALAFTYTEPFMRHIQSFCVSYFLVIGTLVIIGE